MHHRKLNGCRQRLLFTVARNCHGKNKIPHGKTKNLTAKPNTSQQKQNSFGFAVGICFCRELFGFCCEVFVFVGGLWFCRGLCITGLLVELCWSLCLLNRMSWWYIERLGVTLSRIHSILTPLHNINRQNVMANKFILGRLGENQPYKVFMQIQ